MSNASATVVNVPGATLALAMIYQELERTPGEEGGAMGVHDQEWSNDTVYTCRSCYANARGKLDVWLLQQWQPQPHTADQIAYFMGWRRRRGLGSVCLATYRPSTAWIRQRMPSHI